MNDNLQPFENIEVNAGTNFEIYSKKAIWGFSVFFSAIFGAVLLMQNLKDIGKKKEAYLILLLSILYSAITIYLVNIPDEPKSYITLLCNLAGGVILTEFIYNKYFPADENIVKKRIWKPLIISILITIPFILAIIYG